MNITDNQLACIVVFGPLMTGAIALAILHAVIEIQTQRAAKRAWAPIRKDRRHG